MKIQIPISEIKIHLIAAFSRVTSAKDSEYIANAVLFAIAAKDDRMNPLREALDDLDATLKNPSSVDVVRDFGSCRVLDFGGTSPFPLMPKLHEEMASMARKHGFAAVAWRNTAGVHQLSTWIEPLCRHHDVVAICLWNGGSFTVAPFGSKEPFFGTNPIAYGIPSSGDPLLCDMSTSEVPFLSLMSALRGNRNLDRVAGLNPQGELTSNAKEIYDPAGDGPVRLLPMGLGYKGSALMLLIEVITGALIGAKMGREATDSTFIPQEFGGWFLIWDTAAFGSKEEFKRRTAILAEQIRSSAPAKGVEQIRLPGDQANASVRAAAAAGKVRVDDADFARLKSMAQP